MSPISDDEETNTGHGHQTPKQNPKYPMSDDELTQRSVAYLTGKGFHISYM